MKFEVGDPVRVKECSRFTAYHGLEGVVQVCYVLARCQYFVRFDKGYVSLCFHEHELERVGDETK